jgi:hypothetical protein
MSVQGTLGPTDIPPINLASNAAQGGVENVLPTANGGTSSALCTYGQATFASSGSHAVADASITANSIIVISNVASSPVDEQFSVTVTAGTGFTLHSSNSSSAAVLNYFRLA